MVAIRADEFYIRFYLGDERDEALARYLKQFSNAPQGSKPDEAKRLMWLGLQVEKGEQNTLDREAVRHVVREALGETQSTLIDALSSPDLDAGIVRRAVQEAMRDTIEEIGVQERAQSFDLSDIRRVINAALQEYLDHLVLGENASGGSQNNDDEAERIEKLLSNFDRVLIKK